VSTPAFYGINPHAPEVVAAAAALNAAMAPADAFFTERAFGRLAPVAADLLLAAQDAPDAFPRIVAPAVIRRAARLRGGEADWDALLTHLCRLGVPEAGATALLRAVGGASR
jgi:hypothetical protein